MLKNFLNPKSIAIIGASKNKKKIGYQILKNIKTNLFSGKIYPINPKEKTIEGLKTYQSIKNIKNKIDLAIIVIPAKIVLLEIEKCAQIGIKNIIIISAGFSETNSEGKEIEEKIKKIAKKHQLNILGPNCLGFINKPNSLNATFALVDKKQFSKPNQTGIGVISQSGAIGSAILNWIKNKDINLNYFISLGNKAILNENDFFEYFKNNKDINIVVAYLEKIQDGKKFMQTVSKLSKIKPVIILKSGTTKAGKQVALSHTGSLAGSNQAVQAGFNRSGIITVYSIKELFDLIEAFNSVLKNNQLKYLKNNNINIVSNAGGPMVITIDQLSKNTDLQIKNFSPNLIKKLTQKLPEIKTIQNPFDILGDANADRYKQALETILADKDTSILMILLTAQTSTEINETAIIINNLAQKYKNKLICVNFIGDKIFQDTKKIFSTNIINFNYPIETIHNLNKILNYQKKITSLKPYSTKLITKSKIAPDLIQLDYLKSFQTLKKYQIPVLETKKINTKLEFSKLKYPIALKVVGPELIHKSEEKSIFLNVKDKKEAEEIFCNSKLLTKENNYLITQPMLQKGFELIIGFKKDPSFGPLIMVGLGGIYTEIFADIQIEVDDLDSKRALAMIKNLKIYPILNGARGQKKFNIDALVKAIVNIARLAKENPTIQELDINPLFIDSTNILAADVRIIFEK